MKNETIPNGSSKPATEEREQAFMRKAYEILGEAGFTINQIDNLFKLGIRIEEEDCDIDNGWVTLKHGENRTQIHKRHVLERIELDGNGILIKISNVYIRL